ncbi:MAG TPA: sigma-70 family RNA polymerase sigma factor [Burkholderiaceae bacterium]|nr:sigma-70 family RNA polymerase sigma factor [Burkholderiaceae bacterium]
MDAIADAAGANRSIAEAFEHQRAGLRGFIRRRVPDPADAEDILQDVFYELVEAARLMRPVEQVGAWLFTVARNRITDLFRKHKTESIDLGADDESDLMALLPSGEDGPEAAFARRILLEELDAALEELPPEQRSVFIAHELEGRSFKEMAAASGVALNTLLARKRYAVLHLRRRLQAIYDEFGQP